VKHHRSLFLSHWTRSQYRGTQRAGENFGMELSASPFQAEICTPISYAPPTQISREMASEDTVLLNEDKAVLELTSSRLTCLF
jgi:hypothetical protein